MSKTGELVDNWGGESEFIATRMNHNDFVSIEGEHNPETTEETSSTPGGTGSGRALIFVFLNHP